ncbi:hypothetical protein WJX75_004129 [Coccomyxa subellipsoidea]|uniref:Galactokinase n=1 Tax=Coccomyxa subellipsoidea TaxID=248742 RepID=A0ABR2YRB6_9CHLO
MADGTVKTWKDLDRFVKEVYGSPGKDLYDRYVALIEGFKEKYGKAPEIIGRSPGRVNLIGEHIDYEGYSVLPMAIKQDTIVAISESGDDKVHVANLRSGFSEEDFDIDPAALVADTVNHSWVNYVMAAYIGACQYAGQRPTRGLNILVEGQVPHGSGLSSSAALVCSTALALTEVLGVSAPQAEVAQFTAECEKFVGTESGGMDQAISIMGELGMAKLVHFHPIRTEDVTLPDGAIFVIANSLAVSQKAVSAAKQYNLRVVECRLAAALLGLRLGVSKDKARELRTLREVEDLVREKWNGPKGSVMGAESEVVRKLLDKKVYTHGELEKELDMELEDMFAGNPSQLASIKAAHDRDVGGFNLRDRAMHVYSEAARVLEFKAACDSPTLTSEQQLEELARLMDDSHASCRDLYNCSCDELDELVRVCKKAGARGSRLTGAGWGGCTVSLVPQDKVEQFIAEVKREYYMAEVNRKGGLPKEEVKKDGKKVVLWEKDGEDWRPTAGWENVIFASPPGSGGAILNFRQ